MKRSTVFVALVALSAGTAPADAQEPAATPQDQAASSTPTEAEVPGYFRFDYDSYGLQVWVGATHKIGGLEITSDVYVTDSFGEVDFGPQLRLGNLTFLLTVGPIFDFSTQSVVSIVAPFLTTYYDHPKLYLESWLQFIFNSPFADGAEDVFYTRDFALYKATESLWIGPQVEMTYGFAEADAVLSFPIGGQVSVGYGKDNRLSLFLGYETEEQVDPGSGEPVDSDRLAGRITFVRLW